MKKSLSFPGAEALFQALAITLYVGVVAAVMFNAERLFDRINNFLGIAIFLMLFVISAAVVGTLMFGRPAMRYLDGAKKDAVQLVLGTIAWLAVIFIFAIFYLVVR